MIPFNLYLKNQTVSERVRGYYKVRNLCNCKKCGSSNRRVGCVFDGLWYISCAECGNGSDRAYKSFYAAADWWNKSNNRNEIKRPELFSKKEAIK